MSPDDLAQAISGLRQDVQSLRAEIREALGLELLTVEQAARLLKTSSNAIRQQIHRKKIPIVRVMGNRVRIRRQDLVKA